MPLNIKNERVAELAGEVARLTGETKTAAIGRSLAERRERLRAGAGRAMPRRERWVAFLEGEVWPQVPAPQRGRPVTRAEREAILGYGVSGA
ncbi:MAG TPA: type II toxin-antitoxin system VapB family antitoxin [Candidatus Micrarchaeia archaeon]|nr:type II toxin-antitoxin system VapB family antitoxin [Candidatus Micrarchaeia archaeon]